MPLAGVKHCCDHALCRGDLANNLVQQQVDRPRQRHVGRIALDDADLLGQSLGSHGQPGCRGCLGISLDGKHVLGTRAGSNDGKQRERAGANIEAHFAWRVPLDGTPVGPCPCLVVTHLGIRLVRVPFALCPWRVQIRW